MPPHSDVERYQQTGATQDGDDRRRRGKAQDQQRVSADVEDDTNDKCTGQEALLLTAISTYCVTLLIKPMRSTDGDRQAMAGSGRNADPPRMRISSVEKQCHQHRNQQRYHHQQADGQVVTRINDSWLSRA